MEDPRPGGRPGDRRRRGARPHRGGPSALRDRDRAARARGAVPGGLTGVAVPRHGTPHGGRRRSAGGRPVGPRQGRARAHERRGRRGGGAGPGPAPRLSRSRERGAVPAARRWGPRRPGDRSNARGVGIRGVVRPRAGHRVGGGPRRGGRSGARRLGEPGVPSPGGIGAGPGRLGRGGREGEGGAGCDAPVRRGGVMKRRMWAALLLVPLLAAACTSGGKKNPSPGESTSGAVKQTSFRIAVVTHGQASDPFWSVVANGVKAAAQDEGVSVTYNAPTTFDMVAMANLIDAAVASKPDGLIVSIPDADALGPSIKKAVDAGIPVISINSGSDVFADLGVLAQDILGKIQADPAINGILTLGPTASTPAIQALQQANKLGQIKLATFDLSTDVLNAIVKGDML